MDLYAELDEKQRRLNGLLEQRGAEAALLTRRDMFAWFTAGRSNHVGLATDIGSSSLLVTPEHKWLVCDNIEGPRVMDEELAGQGYELAIFPWYAGSVAEQVGRRVKGKVISDTGLAGTENAFDDMAKLRWQLVPSEVERYQELGEMVSRAISATAHAVKPGMTELEMATMLSKRLLEQGVQPTVTLVAVDGRIDRYRHPLPTEARLERRGMLVVCGRKWGLIVSSTRMVHVGPISAELRRKHDAVTRVDEAFIAGSRPGRVVGEVFRAAQAVYQATGFADEWKLHHQGGPTGYNGRDYRANADTTHMVLENQAFAWNPSITGTKSEDTVIATAAGPVAVSWPYDYPSLTLTNCGQEIARADILIL